MSVTRIVFLMLISSVRMLASLTMLASSFSYFIEWELVRLSSVSIVGACILD